MVRYKETFHNERLTTFMRNYQNTHCPDNKLGRKHFHYRVADEQKSFELTGYPHNGVTPFLLGDQVGCIILSETLEKGVGQTQGADWTQAFWLGGGNVDVKLSKID